jgi:hypothetical protein
MNIDHRLEAFVRGSDGALWNNRQIDANNNWSGWSSLGGVLSSDPVAVTNADGRIEVFVSGGQDAALWHIWQIEPTEFQSPPPRVRWSSWASLGGQLRTAPVVATGTNTDGLLEVFYTGHDGQLWHLWQTNGGTQATWSIHASLGGQWEDSPVVGALPDGRREVFAQVYGALWYIQQVDRRMTWSSWVSLGTPVSHNDASSDAITQLSASCTVQRPFPPGTMTYANLTWAKIVHAATGMKVRLGFAELIPAEQLDVPLDSAGSGSLKQRITIYPYSDNSPEHHQVVVQAQWVNGTLTATAQDSYTDEQRLEDGTVNVSPVHVACTLSGAVAAPAGSGLSSSLPLVSIRDQQGACLDASSGALALARCNGSAGQKWTISDDRQVVAANGQCIILDESANRFTLGSCVPSEAEGVTLGGSPYPWEAEGVSLAAYPNSTIELKSADQSGCVSLLRQNLGACQVDDRARFTTWGELQTHDSCIVENGGTLEAISFPREAARLGLCAPAQRWSLGASGQFQNGGDCLTTQGGGLQVAACGQAGQQFHIAAPIGFSRLAVGGVAEFYLRGSESLGVDNVSYWWDLVP